MRAHLPRMDKSREISSYITDLLRNLTSLEGLHLGRETLGPDEDIVLQALHTIPRADIQGVSK
jgi:hypothetical protein